MSNCVTASFSAPSFATTCWLVVGNGDVSAPDDLTNEQLSALLEGWNPDTGGANNKRELLLAAVRNRLALGRLTPDQVLAA